MAKNKPAQKNQKIDPTPDQIFLENFQLKKDSIWKELAVATGPNLKYVLESKDQKTTLSVRNHQEKIKRALKSQASKWLKDYKSYGFDIENNKALKLKNGIKGYYIEAFHRESKNHLIQFMIPHEDQQIATLTCKSSEKKESLQECQELLKSFRFNLNPKTELQSSL